MAGKEFEQSNIDAENTVKVINKKPSTTIESSEEEAVKKFEELAKKQGPKVLIYRDNNIINNGSSTSFTELISEAKENEIIFNGPPVTIETDKIAAGSKKDTRNNIQKLIYSRDVVSKVLDMVKKPSDIVILPEICVKRKGDTKKM
jgi:hypothetical protein